MSIYYAIEFDKSAHNKMAQHQLVLKHNSSAGNFEDKESFHVTVAYVGNDIIDRKQYMDVLDNLNEKFKPKPFEVKLQNFNFFPGQGDGKIAWIGLKDSFPLYVLRSNLLDVIDEMNVKINPPSFPGYTPHITMGYDVVINPNFDTKFEDNTPITIKSICLWDSFKANDTYITNKLYEVFFN